jgi:Zn-dependent protease
LAPDISEQAARELLSLAAAAAARPFLAEALHRHEADERMNAIEILTYGAVVTLVLIVATIEVDWRNGKLVKIKKHALSDATIRTLLEVRARIKPPGQN